MVLAIVTTEGDIACEHSSHGPETVKAVAIVPVQINGQIKGYRATCRYHSNEGERDEHARARVIHLNRED